MSNDPRALLRGVVKLVAVVVVAGLVGAGAGIVLAKLSGNDGGATPALPASVSATSAQPADASPEPQTHTLRSPTVPTTRTETTPRAVVGYRTPRVEVLSALLGQASASTGGALVAVKVRVTNRGGRPLDVGAPALLSGQDEVAVTASATPNPLLRKLDPGASATGTLRFALSAEIAGRLTAKPSARLRVARRIVRLILTKGTP